MGTNLSGVDYFFLVTPVVVALFTWVVLVLRADTHPDFRHAGPVSRRAVPPGGLRGADREAGAARGADALHAQSVPAAGAADEDAASQAAGRHHAPPEHAPPEHSPPERE